MSFGKEFFNSLRRLWDNSKWVNPVLLSFNWLETLEVAVLR